MKPERLLFYLSIAVLLLITVLLVTKFFAKKEGFASFYDTQNKFTREQGTYFGETLNRLMPSNDQLIQSPSSVGDAMFNVDTMININKRPTLPTFSPTADPTPEFKAREKNECLPIKRPMYLKAHTKDEMVGCGWYYMDDDNKLSFSTLGTSNGPIDKDVFINNPGGQWVWDNDKAQKLEDAKKCRKIKSCETSDIYASECGFCQSLSRGVPMEKGKSKYPDDPNLACDVNLYNNPANCPAPPQVAKTIITDTGVVLKSGDIHNGQEIPFVTQSAVCDPDPETGKLTAACLISIAKTVGFSEFGVLIKVLEGDAEGYYTKLGPNFDTMRVTLRIFEVEGNYKLKGPIFGDGAISRAEALNAYRTIFNLITGSPSKRVSNAANWLVTGKEYNPCDYDPNSIGPFEPLCQERVALDAGCQRDGYKFPGPDTYSNNNLLKWSGLKDYYSKLYQGINSNNPIDQRKATLDCLGITIASDVSILCGDPGTPCKVLTEAEIQRNVSVVAAQTNIDTYKQAIPAAKTPIEKKLATELYEQAILLKSQALDKIRRVNKCPANPPIASWDFYLERWDDRIQKYKSSPRGVLNFTTLGGKKCAYFDGPGYIDIKDTVTTTDFKSITMMVYMKSHGSNYYDNQSLWCFMNRYQGLPWSTDILHGGFEYNGRGSNLFISARKNGNQQEKGDNYTPGVGKWAHLAWVIDSDFSGASVYVDGKRVARMSDPRNKSVFENRTFEKKWIMKSHSQYKNNTGVAWFRMFDYSLNQQAIEMDMKNKWIMPPLPPVPKNTGPYNYVGCYADGGVPRTLPTLVGTGKTAEECYKKAIANNATRFGLQYYGEQCFLGKDNDDYTKLGKLDNVTCGGQGSSWNNQVFTINK